MVVEKTEQPDGSTKKKVLLIDLVGALPTETTLTSKTL